MIFRLLCLFTFFTSSSFFHVMAQNPLEEAIIRCETSAGPFVMKLNREWSPNGYDRAVELFERKFFDNSHFFRVVPNFLVQFGISYSDDKSLQKFAKSTIPDDPPKHIPFHKGTISYAGSGKNSRTSHLFISYGSAASLGKQVWETPLGEVIQGMENIEKLYSYGDMPPWGKGPVQHKIYDGPSYIEDNFPETDKFHHCKVERLGDGGANAGDPMIVRKADGTTDEEEFHKAREEAQQRQQRHRELQEKEQTEEDVEVAVDVPVPEAETVEQHHRKIRDVLGKEGLSTQHKPHQTEQTLHKPHQIEQPHLPADNENFYLGIGILGFILVSMFAFRSERNKASKAN